MKKRVLLVMSVASGLGVAFLLVLFHLPVQASSVDVLVSHSGGIDQANCGDGIHPPCYSIEYALQNIAVAGDRVLVAAGIYTETLTMKLDVAVVGQSGSAMTILDGEGVRGPLVGIYNYNPSITFTTRLVGFTVRNSSVQGIAIYGASPVISDCVIQSNHSSYGGGITINQPTASVNKVVISYSRIVSNTATGDAGGIWAIGGVNLTLEHSAIISNTAKYWGGGVLGNAAILTISDTLFQDNVANHGGGVLAANGSSLTLLNSQFYSNTAGSSGGGIHVRDGSTFEIRNNVVEHNVANGAGGINISSGAGGTSKGSILSNILRYNRTRNGRGGGIAADESMVVISGNVIFSNTATSQGGGGIDLSNELATVTYNTIQSNAADYHGGGILVENHSTITISQNTLLNNSAAGNGGGIEVADGSVVTITQNRIADNTSDGLYVAYAQGFLANNFILQNHIHSEQAQVRLRGNSPFVIMNNTLVGDGHAAGIRLEDNAAPAISNTIVAGNEYGIQASGMAGPAMGYNNLWNNSVAAYDSVTPGMHDLARNPDFVNAVNGDYHLGICSWAVDGGMNAGAPPTDYDGDARPVDGNDDGIATVDIGADERLTVTTPMPAAAFTYTVKGLALVLTNTSSNALSYLWVMGDGIGTSTAVNPVYAFTAPGNYTVTLTATGGFGCQDLYQQSVQMHAVIYLPLVLRTQS